VPYEILEGHYRSIHNGLDQVDFVFVKEDRYLDLRGVFFQISNWSDIDLPDG
jgi:hypothetical protein